MMDEDDKRLLSLYQAGAFSDVEIESEKLIREGKSSKWIYNLLAVSLHRQGNLARAVDSYEKAIQIDPEFTGIPVSLYLDQLIGVKITGRTSGITAKVVKYITDEESERSNYTLYVDYIESASTNSSTSSSRSSEPRLLKEYPSGMSISIPT